MEENTDEEGMDIPERPTLEELDEEDEENDEVTDDEEGAAVVEWKGDRLDRAKVVVLLELIGDSCSGSCCA